MLKEGRIISCNNSEKKKWYLYKLKINWLVMRTAEMFKDNLLVFTGNTAHIR